MIGKIFGAIAGERVAQNVNGVSGPTGALLGVGTVALARRLSPLGLIAAVAGGYALKRYLEKDGKRPRPAPSAKRRKKQAVA